MGSWQRATAKKTPRELAAAILPATFLGPAALAEQGIARRQVAALVAGEQLIRFAQRPLCRPRHPGRARPGRSPRGSARLRLAAELAGDLRAHARRPACAGAAEGEPAARSGAGRHPALAAEFTPTRRPGRRCRRGTGPGLPVPAARHALATMDSAWHHGIVDEKKINAVFARLPRRFRRLRGLLDKRAESGPETLVRLMLRGLGCDAVVQVRIPRVGRVDIVVDGWLIVECDSEEFHSGWTAQKRDRRRDLEAAAQGYTTIRLLAEDILYHPERVLAALKAVLATAPHRR
ncbi:endonuclease domain-containing protein [Microbacterium elymi]|uniref:DUF559 domain-containing protein n=1 Tax=Microbacterium elymi TaxID=2909587 RepID=A0ABY5NKW0_9MICO|nr:DUF559 domain-containing protein [Microbacterium elymi]UUT35769.1 DUF559 domain-containing protein [Microbacterium elymi]